MILGSRLAMDPVPQDDYLGGQLLATLQLHLGAWTANPKISSPGY